MALSSADFATVVGRRLALLDLLHVDIILLVFIVVWQTNFLLLLANCLGKAFIPAL